MKKTIYLFLLLLIIPLISAESISGGGTPSGPAGGGGSGGTLMRPLLYTYDECNALYEDTIGYYKEAAEKADKVFGIFLILVIAFVIVTVITLFIQLGMAIQQIKDKGFRKWWSGQWGCNKDEDNRKKK